MQILFFFKVIASKGRIQTLHVKRPENALTRPIKNKLKKYPVIVYKC